VRRRRARDSSGRLLSDAELRRQTADSLEYLYDEGRASKRDVVAWVRLSAKLSGRVYEPGYVSGRYHDHLKLRRREDVEERMHKKRAGYYRRDAHTLNPTAENALRWIGNTGGLRGYGTAPNHVASQRLVRLGLAHENPSRPGQYRLTENGRIAYEFYRGAKRRTRSSGDESRGTRYRVKLVLDKPERHSLQAFTATIYQQGRAVATGRGMTAERAFHEAQKKAGIRGSYVVPRSVGYERLFSTRPVFFVERMR
jgi:hypothetical protein